MYTKKERDNADKKKPYMKYKHRKDKGKETEQGRRAENAPRKKTTIEWNKWAFRSLFPNGWRDKSRLLFSGIFSFWTWMECHASVFFFTTYYFSIRVFSLSTQFYERCRFYSSLPSSFAIDLIAFSSLLPALSFLSLLFSTLPRRNCEKKSSESFF